MITKFKQQTRDDMIKRGLEFPLSEWVSIELNNNNYETNRYDVSFYCNTFNTIVNTYIYMDESSDKIIAIDSTSEMNNQYILTEYTSLLSILEN